MWVLVRDKGSSFMNECILHMERWFANNLKWRLLIIKIGSFDSVLRIWARSDEYPTNLACPPGKGMSSNRLDWRVQTWAERRFEKWHRFVSNELEILTTNVYTNYVSAMLREPHMLASFPHESRHVAVPMDAIEMENWECYII